MENITFNLSELHNHGTAYFDYLALRKKFFVDTLGWDIPHNETYEMDQYDNPLAHYSLVLRNGKVVGGARAMPTTSNWGDYSYMIKDAASGKLGGIPNKILSEPVSTPRVWECTRLVVADDLDSHQDRFTCLSLIVDGLADTAHELGAGELIALMRPSFVRALRQLGYAANLVGESYFNPEDGRKYAVLSMPATRSSKPAPPVHPKAKPAKSPVVQRQPVPELA